MSRMLLAETAVLAHFNTVRIVPLILHRVVVSLLALGTGQHDFNTYTCLRHTRHLLLNMTATLYLGPSKHACSFYISPVWLSTSFFKILNFFLLAPVFAVFSLFSHFFSKLFRNNGILSSTQRGHFHFTFKSYKVK